MPYTAEEFRRLYPGLFDEDDTCSWCDGGPALDDGEKCPDCGAVGWTLDEGDETEGTR